MALGVGKKFQDKKDLFIQKLGELVPYHEWDDQLIKEVESECGLAAGYSFILFAGGIDEIITTYETYKDQEMLKLLTNAPAPAKIREKIAQALKTRVKDCSPKVVLKKNRRFLCKPDKLSLASKIAWKTCDTIWRYAGDSSTDFNHYSKRALLLSVYLSSIVFYINDESKDFIETDNFIDSQLKRIINIANFKNIIKLPKIEDIPILRLFS